MVAIEGTDRAILGQENADFKVAQSLTQSPAMGAKLGTLQRGQRGPAAQRADPWQGGRPFPNLDRNSDYRCCRCLVECGWRTVHCRLRPPEFG